MDQIERKKTERKNGIIFLLVLSPFGLVPTFTFLSSFSLFSKTLFEREQAAYKPYFHDDFNGYDANSDVLDRAPEDLSRWKDAGSITAWLDVTDWQKVDEVDMTLTDADGKSATFKGLPNLKLPRAANKQNSDDAFPDYQFDCDQAVKKWEDYLIADGRNLLFWEYANDPGIDMSRVVSWKATDQGVELPVKDVVIQDGLCDDKNSLAGNWRSPNGLPQYGVFWAQDGKLVMRNVESSQYPSNGDHVRIMSRVTTPKNFLMKTRFTVTHLDEKHLDNTYLRVAWDFDDVFDPGHDQTLVYENFKYGYFGLQRIHPIERYYLQSFEPATDMQVGKTRYDFKEGHTYEMDVKVEGQSATVELYDLEGKGFRRVARTSYTFGRARPELGYPFAIETTGNVNILLDDFEVMSK